MASPGGFEPPLPPRERGNSSRLVLVCTVAPGHADFRHAAHLPVPCPAYGKRNAAQIYLTANRLIWLRRHDLNLDLHFTTRDTVQVRRDFHLQFPHPQVAICSSLFVIIRHLRMDQWMEQNYDYPKIFNDINALQQDIGGGSGTFPQHGLKAA